MATEPSTLQVDIFTIRFLSRSERRCSSQLITPSRCKNKRLVAKQRWCVLPGFFHRSRVQSATTHRGSCTRAFNFLGSPLPSPSLSARLLYGSIETTDDANDEN